ncbi:MAG: hypothetical protein ACO1TE_19505 [Prosthecobacter sp.]
MKTLPGACALLMLLIPAATTCASAADDAAKKTAAEDEDKTTGTVFREPFTLKLHVDTERFYEEKFGKIPYVHEGDVHLFKDDRFGLSLDIQEDAVRAVRYEPDFKKADVTLIFTQDVKADGETMMLLQIRNKTKHPLRFDGLMTVPGNKSILQTRILPIRPGMSSFESWPHPIVQLVLQKLRIEK